MKTAQWYDGANVKRTAPIKTAGLWTRDLKTPSSWTEHDVDDAVVEYLYSELKRDTSLNLHFDPYKGHCFLSSDTVGYCDGDVNLRYGKII